MQWLTFISFILFTSQRRVSHLTACLLVWLGVCAPGGMGSVSAGAEDLSQSSESLWCQKLQLKSLGMALSVCFSFHRD